MANGLSQIETVEAASLWTGGRRHLVAADQVRGTYCTPNVELSAALCGEAVMVGFTPRYPSCKRCEKVMQSAPPQQPTGHEGDGR